MSNLEEANRMLDAFASVGARKFDVTFLNIDGEKRGFRKAQTIDQLKNSLPKLLPGLTERQNSLVIRPVNHIAGAGNMVSLVQLDDLSTNLLEHGIKEFAFLTLTTSPGNHQAWVAVRPTSMSGTSEQKELSRRLRKRTGADQSASGAVRLAGTRNFKVKYAPNFPTVSIDSIASGRIVTPEQLDAAGLLAPPEPERPLPPLLVSSSRTWPDYQRCVEGAPMNNSGTSPDISRADFFYAKMCADRGYSLDEIAERLMELSSKAKENGERYARVTAENAAAVAGNRGRSRT